MDDEKYSNLRSDVDSLRGEVDGLSLTITAHVEQVLNALPSRDHVEHLHDHIQLRKEWADKERREENFNRRRDELIWGVIKYFLAATGIVILGMTTLGGKVYLREAVESAPVVQKP